MDFKIVSLVFPKIPTIEMLKDKITNSLDYFGYNNKFGAIYKKLRERLLNSSQWEDFR